MGKLVFIFVVPDTKIDDAKGGSRGLPAMNSHRRMQDRLNRAAETVLRPSPPAYSTTGIPATGQTYGRGSSASVGGDDFVRLSRAEYERRPRARPATPASTVLPLLRRHVTTAPHRRLLPTRSDACERFTPTRNRWSCCLVVGRAQVR